MTAFFLFFRSRSHESFNAKLQCLCRLSITFNKTDEPLLCIIMQDKEWEFNHRNEKCCPELCVNHGRQQRKKSVFIERYDTSRTWYAHYHLLEIHFDRGVHFSFVSLMSVIHAWEEVFLLWFNLCDCNESEMDTECSFPCRYEVRLEREEMRNENQEDKSWWDTPSESLCRLVNSFPLMCLFPNDDEDCWSRFVSFLPRSPLKPFFSDLMMIRFRRRWPALQDKVKEKGNLIYRRL